MQSSKLRLQYIENSPSGTIVVAIDPDFLEEPVLVRDMFKVARNNFMISTPIELSYPSIDRITVIWAPIPEGNDAGEEKIIYYSLEWDQGPIQEWQQLTTPGILVNSYTQTTGFAKSLTYTYRVRAMDLIGYGQYSNLLTVVPMDLPDQTDIPVTVIKGINVKISWIEPFGNGDPIFKYRVYLQMKSGLFRLEDTFCNEKDTALSRSCMIPMSILTGPIYQLVKYDLIVAQVESANAIGYGLISEPNIIGAQAEELPLVAGTPVRGPLTSHLVLDVNWTTIAHRTSESGGLTCDIISYNL